MHALLGVQATNNYTMQAILSPITSETIICETLWGNVIIVIFTIMSDLDTCDATLPRPEAGFSQDAWKLVRMTEHCRSLQIQKSNGVKYMPGVGPAVPQQCPETGANFLMGGPFWADPIHNMEWVQGILDSVKV